MDGWLGGKGKAPFHFFGQGEEKLGEIQPPLLASLVLQLGGA